MKSKDTHEPLHTTSHTSLEIPETLISKYSVSGPRYTSYPTAVEFSPDMTSSVWEKEITEDANNTSELCKENISHTTSLYTHIPFCDGQCYFCACHKIVPHNRSIVKSYINTLCKEMKLYANLLTNQPIIEQIHWGGGSPDFLTPDEMNLIWKNLIETFGLPQKHADISIELDPRKTTPEHISLLSSYGVNRISLGVQDFDSKVQECINRKQSIDITSSLMQCARKHGISSVNLDLIYGLPEQTIQSFTQTLEKVLKLRPDRIALYGYAHVTWLKNAQQALDNNRLPSPQERIALFLTAIQTLTASGYEYIGMDHFALPTDSLSIAHKNGRLNRNFMGYTSHQGTRVIGFGASSISSTPYAYAQNEKEIAAYQQIIHSSTLAITRGKQKNKEDCLRGDIIESILCNGNVSIRQIENKWDISFWDHFADKKPEILALEDDNLVSLSENSLKLTPVGRVLARNTAMVFDEYLYKHTQRQKKVFSQTI